jgi:GT2 family glycosyltransferase
MKITFVTVAYKGPELIRNLLKGVELAKFDFPFEYILVNNNAGDATAEIVKEQFPWVTYVDAPGNVGFAAGNNIGFRLAKGEYVMCVNPDLTIFPGEVEKLVQYADAHPEFGIVGPRLLNPNGTIQKNFHRFPSPLIPVYRRTLMGKTPWGKRAIARYFLEDVDPMSLREVDGLFGAALLIRKKALEDFGHFDEGYFMYFEDVDLCRRAWEKGWKVGYFPDACFVHYHQRESYSKQPWKSLFNPLSRAHIASAVRYFRKFYGKPSPRASSVST